MKAKQVLKFIETRSDDIRQEMFNLLLDHDFKFVKLAKILNCKIVGRPGQTSESLRAELDIINDNQQDFLTAKKKLTRVKNYAKEISNFFKTRRVEIHNSLMAMDKIELDILPSQELQSKSSRTLNQVLCLIIVLIPKTFDLKLFIWPNTSRYNPSLWFSKLENTDDINLYIKESLTAMETMIKAIRLTEYK